MSFKMHCNFDTGSFKIKVLLGGGSHKKYSVYVCFIIIKDFVIMLTMLDDPLSKSSVTSVSFPVSVRAANASSGHLSGHSSKFCERLM